jgi:hypothetical protein
LAFCLSIVAAGRAEEPERVSTCQATKDPEAYNHKLVEVTAFVSHGFENFMLFDPACPPSSQIWLEYGGSGSSCTMYCCGVTADRTRPGSIKVEGIPRPLVNDKQFQEFERLIQRRP